MFNWFKKDKSPEKCVRNIVHQYFGDGQAMGDDEYYKLKECLENWESTDDPEYLGVMAYIKYKDGDINKMWDYIEKDLHLELGEEEHGAFIPAMMADVPSALRYEILKKIYHHVPGVISLEIMASLASELGKNDEVLSMIDDFLKKNPKNKKVLKIREKLNVNA